jgi:hypothetical protein
MDRRLWLTPLAMVAAPALFSAAPVRAAANPGYLGSWVIAEVHPAPWVDAAKPATAPFDDHLVGRKVTYTPTRIAAPRPLACTAPRYRWVAYSPDSLFQGGLTVPAAQAATLGFSPAAIPTLETGCEGLIDFHFTTAGTALFALNDNIYTLRRMATGAAKR